MNATTIAPEGNGLLISEVGLTYPSFTGEPSLVAYASFKISNGAGFDLYVKSAKLMRDSQTGYFVQLPHEPKKAKCVNPVCRGRNADHANFCNWCGVSLNPENGRGWFYDAVVPANTQTRAVILSALVDEHRKRTEG